MFDVNSVDVNSSSNSSSEAIFVPSRCSINFINNDKKIYSSDSDKSAHRQTSDLPLKCLYTNAQSIVN